MDGKLVLPEARLIENIVECKVEESAGLFAIGGGLIENIVECKAKPLKERTPRTGRLIENIVECKGPSYIGASARCSD